MKIAFMLTSSLGLLFTAVVSLNLEEIKDVVSKLNQNISS